MIRRERPDRFALPHLVKRAQEILDECKISEKVGVYKKLAKVNEWMDPDYKEELEEILRLFVEQNK